MGSDLSFCVNLFLGAFSHVISRGNTRKDIYLEDSDFELFLELSTNVCKMKDLTLNIKIGLMLR